MARILVVDDEPHIVKLVSFTLERNGHEVLSAQDGPAGIELARSETPDLILMDVMMPIMTGIEALEKLKADAATESIPVAMLSAKSQHYEQEEGLRKGAVRYVCKPFTPRDLAEVVSDILGTGQGKESEG